MLYQLSYSRITGAGGRIRTFEGLRRQIYSLLPLAARAPLHKQITLELAMGLEPATPCLQGRCSTFELRQLSLPMGQQ